MIDGLFCTGNQPNGCATSTLALRFPDGNSNNNYVNNCTSPKLARPGDNILWGATTGINEFRPTSAITVATYTDPQVAPNGTDMTTPSYIGAFQNQTDNWGDANMNWVAFPVN
jgi:hypothetical protein